MKPKKSARALRARERLNRLKAAAPEQRHQCYQDWLYAATAAEVRRYWRQWMPDFPAWAV